MVKDLHLICGFLAAIVTTLSTYPLNKLIYRQILEQSKLTKAYDNVFREGPYLLYRGVFPPILQKVVALSTMFSIFNLASEQLKVYQLNQRVETLLAGIASGTMEATMMPFERIQLLLMDSKYQNRFKNTLDAFVKVRKLYGVKEYYRGFRIILIRCVVANCCFFLAKGETQRMFGVGDSVFSEGFKNFCTGGLIGGVVSVIVYPFKVIKVVYHRELGGVVPSIPQVVSMIYYADGKGLPNFFRGVTLNGGRALLSWGITNMSFEFFMQLLSSDVNKPK